MALETFVKVGKVNNLSDARYCAGMGVDVIGFNLVPGTPNYVAPEKYSEITEWLAGVDFAGEFEGLSGNEIKEQLKKFDIQYIQITDPDLIADLATQEVPVIFKVDMDQNPDLSRIPSLLQQFQGQVAYFLFESQLESFDPQKQEDLLALAKTYPVLLGYGLKAENVLQLVRNTAIKGIALLGEDEIRAGYKDFDHLAEILELLEVDEFGD